MPGRRVVGLIAWPLLSLVVAVLLGWALGAAVDAWVQPDGVREPGPETLLFVAAFPIIIGLGALIQSLGWLVGAAVGGLTWTIGLIWGAWPGGGVCCSWAGARASWGPGRCARAWGGWWVGARDQADRPGQAADGR